MKIKSLLLVGLAQSLALISPLLAESAYHLLKTIPISSDGGWDYLSVDAVGRRLYVAHATRVVVIDLDRDIVVGEVADTQGVHGFAIAPEIGRGFASNGKENTVSIVDLKTLKTLSKVATGANPDAVFYEPTSREVYAFNGRGKSATVFAAETGALVATIDLPGKPEFAAGDPDLGVIFCNIEDTSQVVAISTKTHSIKHTWTTAPGAEPTGLAIDVRRHRLFVGCSNQTMVMIDAVSGKVLAQVPAGEGVDATAFDPGRGLAFSSAGDGTVTIAKADASDHFSVVQKLQTVRGARTLTLDPATNKIYLAAVDYEVVPAAASPSPKSRPKPLPGTFKVLVYGN